MTEVKKAVNIPRTKSVNGWIYKLFLFASFLWTNFFTSVGSMISGTPQNFGNLFNLASPNFSFIVAMTFIQALISMIVFELIFYLYRKILCFRIYSFIVPEEKIGTDSRLYYTYRNLIYGFCVNACFFVPGIYIYLPLLSVVITLTMLIAYALHLNRMYSEPIINHFVFKSFCLPLFVFETLVVLGQMMEVML